MSKEVQNDHAHPILCLLICKLSINCPLNLTSLLQELRKMRVIKQVVVRQSIQSLTVVPALFTDFLNLVDVSWICQVVAQRCVPCPTHIGCWKEMVVVRQRNQAQAGLVLVAGLVRLISRISNLQANLHEYVPLQRPVRWSILQHHCLLNLLHGR